MPRHLILGTAGHIDHGKTALVRALTGIDADRLPEEKRRGITIDLGFAELDMGDVRLGFVDVPGHERFVKNMLAGAHGIDLVLLVIAADEGVMPQTREHFDICRLLETGSGLVVITKTDTVDSDLISLVVAEAEEMVAGSFLEGAPIVEVSSRTGAGLDKLRDSLGALARGAQPRSSGMAARLPIDRAFSMRGFGAVVTGTLVAGEIHEGEEMELLPSGARVRVRGVQVHGHAVRTAAAGQRTAVNLSGVDAPAIERGMMLAPVGRLRPVQMIDCELNVLQNAPKAIRSRARVRLHIGAVEALARVRVLEEGGELEPGETGLVQLRIESPIVALPDEHFIIRSYSPSRTIAGGRVLDAFAIKHRGREMESTRERLNSMSIADRAGRLGLFAEAVGATYLRQADFAARTGWNDQVVNEATQTAIARGLIVDADGVFVTRDAFESLARDGLSEIKAHHKREPLSRGLPRETLRERLFAHAPQELFRSLVAQLENQGLIASEKDVIRAADHNLSLSSADKELKTNLEHIYKDAGLAAPTFDEALERMAGTRPTRPHARKILQLLIDENALVHVTGELFFHREALDHLQRSLKKFASEHEPDRLIGVPAFKDLAGISRKYAIPLLEYLDRERITRRSGDNRMIL